MKVFRYRISPAVAELLFRIGEEELGRKVANVKVVYSGVDSWHELPALVERCVQARLARFLDCEDWGAFDAAVEYVSKNPVPYNPYARMQHNR
jgi:molybdopterin/thiamine biosynthesis adenylyltransferase